MGYNSDVRFLIEEKNFNRLCKKMEKHYLSKPESHNLMKHLDVKQFRTGCCFESKKQIRYVYFGWNCVKWYECQFKRKA